MSDFLLSLKILTQFLGTLYMCTIFLEQIIFKLLFLQYQGIMITYLYMHVVELLISVET